MSTPTHQREPVPAPRVFRIMVITLGIGATLALAGLVLAMVSPISLPFQKVIATVTPEVQVSGRMARVTGTTTLPDGAVLHYSFEHETGAHDMGASTTVRNGSFSFNSDLSGWPVGEVTLYVEFAVGFYDESDQPANVTAIFGSQGEHLDGPQVYIDSPGDPNRLLARVPFSLPQEESPSD